MKQWIKFCAFVLPVAVFLASCGGSPEAVNERPAVTEPVPSQAPEQEEPADEMDKDKEAAEPAPAEDE